MIYKKNIITTTILFSVAISTPSITLADSMVVDGDEHIKDKDMTLTGNLNDSVKINNGGSLTVNNSHIKIDQDKSKTHGFYIENGAKLKYKMALQLIIAMVWKGKVY